MMSRQNFTRLKWIGFACLAAAVSILVLPRCVAAQDQRQNAPYTSVEFSAYKAVRDEQHPPKKFALLDSFIAEYPNSTLLASVFHEYATTYLVVGNSRESIEYIDKFLAQLENINPEMLPEGMFGRDQRLDGLYFRTRAYLEGGCSDTVFQTPEAYRQARDAATEGLRLLGGWNERPRNMKDYEFQYLKNQAGVRFSAAARIAASGLEGANPIDLCRPAGADFDRIINDIKTQDRESPRVR